MAQNTIIDVGRAVGGAVYRGGRKVVRGTRKVVNAVTTGSRYVTNITDPGGHQRVVDVPMETNLANGNTFAPGAEIDILSQDWEMDAQGYYVKKKRRKRRKRMLTCSDRSDISFITATLGKGEMAKSAIAALISNCH